jgi:predicted DNA-binding transcriptional regulator AlpA
MRIIEPLLGIDELMWITGLSRVSIYRKVAAARVGQSRFPIPLSDRKEQLKWSAASVESYCQTQPQPVTPPDNVDCPLKEKKLMQKQRAHDEQVRRDFQRRLQLPQSLP